MYLSRSRTDIYSIALTTVSSLLRKYDVDPTSIGRLEVGTETLLDKSKSVKSVLMQLFSPSGNTSIEGVDTTNACYGGTNALFNSINWIESSAWDGRDAIVVAGDIALYHKGNARPTGGAGCVAMLIGPGAPLVFEPGLRGTYIIHAYDFYKPDMTSEYPIVDGQYSLRSYSQAMDACYQSYNQREAKSLEKTGVNGVANDEPHSPQDQPQETPLDRFDHMCFHSPTCKTVMKSYARMLYNDYLANPNAPLFANDPSITPELRTLDYHASLTDKSVERVFQAMTKKKFAARVQPGIMVPTQCGNMYCASLYSMLCGLIANVPSPDLQGKRIGMFSYGSGLASSFFSLRVMGSTENMAQKLDLKRRLDGRRTVKPEVYDETCVLRERAHLAKDFKPEGKVENIVPGVYYLTGIDGMFRRSYEVKAA